MNELIKKVKKAREFWSKIAKENGWSMEDRGVTIWVDKDMNQLDSIYNTQDSDTSYIVDYETQNLIKEIKH